MTRIDKDKLTKIVPTEVNWSREVQLDYYRDLDQWREITKEQYAHAYKKGLPDRDYHEIQALDDDAFLLDDPIEYSTKGGGEINYGFVYFEGRYFARVMPRHRFTILVAALRMKLGVSESGGQQTYARY